ncbi:hypothetical protein OU5_P0327 (plasmid) [Pseudomonas mandelii JR-1]|uniref:Uncharacterized protein n=1 Tax=Pseudomonas mandelii JR-1 TaxID=1147786 RepID=A0A024EKY8_9PSED|nr:hypothetical protein OU5_P0327 [Pseudomonas mandelii JR-1]
MLLCQKWQMELVRQTHGFVRWIQPATAKGDRWVPCLEGKTSQEKQSIPQQAKEPAERPCRPIPISWRAIRQTGCTAAGTEKSKTQVSLSSSDSLVCSRRHDDFSANIPVFNSDNTAL